MVRWAAMLKEALQLRAGRLRPLYREEYDRLVDLGVFKDERIELLEGALVRNSPVCEPCAWVVSALTKPLVLELEGRARIRVRAPISASEISAPEPDIAVVPITRDLVRPGTAFLVVEVAVSSLQDDLDIKVPIYARARFPEVWVIDVEGQRAHVFRQPELGHYREHRVVEREGTLTVAAFSDLTVTLAELLPPV